jgi:hypothetical protein
MANKQHFFFLYQSAENCDLGGSYRLAERFEDVAGHCATVAPAGTVQVVVTRVSDKKELFRGTVAELAAVGGTVPPVTPVPAQYAWTVVVRGLDDVTLYTETVWAVDRCAAEGFATGILRRYRTLPGAKTVKEVFVDTAERPL